MFENNVAIAILARGAVTVKEATARYGVGRHSLYDLMNKGLLPWTQAVGCRSRLIPVISLERLLAANMKGPIHE